MGLQLDIKFDFCLTHNGFLFSFMQNLILNKNAINITIGRDRRQTYAIHVSILEGLWPTGGLVFAPTTSGPLDCVLYVSRIVF